MSKRKTKKQITEKHIEAIADQNLTVIVEVFGNVQLNVPGKITGRIRNRFKQFIFVPTFPFMTVNFSASDVESIEVTQEGIVLSLMKAEEPKKRRKKKKAPPVVPAETAVDLNQPAPEVAPV